MSVHLPDVSMRAAGMGWGRLDLLCRLKERIRKSLCFSTGTVEDGLKRLAEEGKAEFRHSGHFLYRERE